jgi:excisionase family DNA binding protein
VNDSQLIKAIQQAVHDELASALGRYAPVENAPVPLSEAAKILGLTTNGMYQLNTNNVIPYTRPSGRKVYYQRSDLLTYLNSNKSKTGEQLDSAAATYISLSKLK